MQQGLWLPHRRTDRSASLRLPAAGRRIPNPCQLPHLLLEHVRHRLQTDRDQRLDQGQTRLQTTNDIAADLDFSLTCN